MSEKIVEIEGVKYHTLLEGRPTGTESLILLCHALMSNMRMWDDTVKTLNNAGYSTLRFDHIGHDRTPAPSDPNASFHMDDIANHMHQLVERVTGQRHVSAVIGCSIGGVLALRYAILFPKDVDQIISIAAPGIAVPEKAKILWAQRIEQFERDEQSGENSLCHATVQRWFPGSRSDDERARARALEHVKTCSLRGYRILAHAITTYDYSEEVGGIEGVKCLIVAGSEDGAISPEGLRELSTRIEGANYVLMEGAGHLPPMHKVDEFDGIMMRFLKS